MIESTTDYEKFKYKACNRDINPANLRKIKNSIAVKDLLKYRPILVDKEFYVIDGQHRLEAAKQLSVPIYYQIQTGCVPEDIIILNSNQKKWDMCDYFKFYCHAGKPEYLKLKAFMEEHNQSILDALRALGKVGGSYYFPFRKGTYKHPDDESSGAERLNFQKKIINELRECMMRDHSVLDTFKFKRALGEFSSRSDVDLDIFTKSLILNSSWIKPCARYTEYTEIFIKIYNYRRKDRI